jgi:hypothetical protein
MKGELLGWLESIEAVHARLECDAALALRVQALKRYQQRRMEGTYRDLLASPRYTAATRFFLVDLYGPVDFRQRDREFARIVPRVHALFPRQISATVDQLARLHALSEDLDVAMASELESSSIRPSDYLAAWKRVGRRDDRYAQLALVVEIGTTLDHLTPQRWLATSLRLMRGPARAAGLAELQKFLERGLASFRGLNGGRELVAIIGAREAALMHALFHEPAAAVAELPPP